MAELGDYLQQGATSGKEVTVEMMDYKHIEICEDPTELRAILNRLRSKEEGYYPHLEKTIEDKLMGMLPEKERRKVVALRSGPDAQEISEAASVLSAWTDMVRLDDKAIEDEANEDYVRPLPPVRGQKATKTKVVNQEDSKPKKKANQPSSHVYDAPDYFRKWDAFDAEAEEQAIETSEVESLLEAERATKAHEVKEKGRAARREAELADLRGKMSWATMSKVQRNRFALLEKNKGNECFKGGEPEEAMHYYSRALALLDEDHEQACVVWANRAMAALKVGLLERAEDDCGRAIHLNPDYHKARLRRGMTRHKRGRYGAAVEDFDWLLQAGTSIDDVAKLRERSYQKHLEVEGGSMGKIVEMSSSVAVPVKDGAPPLLDPAAWDIKPFVVPSSIEQPGAKTFTRIAISVDDDDSSEEEESTESVAKVVIIEEDEEEDHAEESKGLSEWEAAQLKQKGVELFMKSQYTDATATFEKSLAAVEAAALHQSKSVSVVFGNLWHALRNNLAACALATEQWDKVVTHCDAVLHHQPANLKALLRRAEARERLGLTAGACSDLRAALRIDAHNVDAASRLNFLSSAGIGLSAPAEASEAAKVRGNEAMTRGCWEEAWALYTDALAHDPSNTAARNNRCMCALKQERWQEAEADANGVLSSTPENAKALFRRATARKNLGNFEGAETDLLTTLVVEPTNAKAKSLLDEVRTLLSEQSHQIEKLRSHHIEVVGEEDDDEPLIEDVPRRTRVPIVDEDEEIDEEEKGTRVPIVDEDEEIDEEEKGTRVPIVDDDEESDEEEKGTRVPIIDDDEESDEEEKGTRVPIVDDDEESDEEEKGTRVPIIDEDEESDEEFSPYREEAAIRSEDCKLKGNRAMSAGDFLLAHKCYSQALHFDKDNIAALNNRSVAALKLARFSEARDDACAVLEKDACNVKALMRRAEALAGLFAWAGAVSDLQAVLQIEPSNAEADARLKEAFLHLAGSVTNGGGVANEPESVQETPVLEVQPQVGAPVLEVCDRVASDEEKALGNTRLKAGEYDDAEAHYAQAIELDVSNTAAYNNRALCRLRQKNWMGCVSDASMVLERETGNSKALLRRSQALDALGKFEEARSDLVEVLKVDPKHKEANSRFVGLMQKKKAQESNTPLLTPVSSSSSSPNTQVASVPKKTLKKEEHTPAVRTIKVKVKVPSEAPNTISELERSWRELKAHPGHLASYLKLFKAGTYKKVFKESISPEIIPQLLAVANTELSCSTSSSFDLPAALRVLKGLTRSKCFSFTLMLLSEDDKANIKGTLDALQVQAKYHGDIEDLQSMYGL